MFSRSTHFLVSMTLILGLNACGGGGSSDTSAQSSKKKSYFIDSPVEGLNYECDNTSGVTDSNGTLLCDTTPIVLKLGEMTIGILNEFTFDSKVYPQDLLGLERNNFTDENLIKLIRLLQSLDDNGDIEQTIVIPKEISDYYDENLNFEQSMLEILAAPAYGDVVEEASAIAHLQDSMGSDAHIGSTNTPETNATDADPENIINDILDNTLDANESNLTEDNVTADDIETVEF